MGNAQNIIFLAHHVLMSLFAHPRKHISGPTMY